MKGQGYCRPLVVLKGFVMVRSAASAAIPKNRSDQHATAAELLSDGAFQVRLAKARDDREKALAELGGDEAPLRRRKPWERRTAARPTPSSAKQRPDEPLILTEQERLPGAAPVAISGGPAPVPAPRPTDTDAPILATGRDLGRRRGSMPVLLAFLSGIAIGLGAASLAWFSSIPSPSPEPGATANLADVAKVDDGVVGLRDTASLPFLRNRSVGISSDAEGPPSVFADGPQPFALSAVTATTPAVSIAQDGDVSFAPPLALAPPREARLDLPLPPQEPAVALSQAVFLQAPTGVAENAVAGARDAVERAGFTVAQTLRVRLPISRSNVRYFHPEDAAAAIRLAGEIDAIARDFTSYRPLPMEGTIEVWLAGRSAGSTRRVPIPQRAERDEQLLLLRRLIIEKLRGLENPGP